MEGNTTSSVRLFISTLSFHQLALDRYFFRLTAAYWRPAAAAESSDCGRGNAVGLTSILDLRQFLVLIMRLAHQSAAHVHAASSSFIFCGQMEDFFENTNRSVTVKLLP